MIETKLDEYARWCASRHLTSCRLVHYVGVDSPNAIDVPLSQVRNQIEGCLREGLMVAWGQRDSCVYLAIQEPGCPMPSWEKVWKEEALVDVEALVREAGFDSDA